jgi:hypothetical protein
MLDSELDVPGKDTILLTKAMTGWLHHRVNAVDVPLYSPTFVKDWWASC